MTLLDDAWACVLDVGYQVQCTGGQPQPQTATATVTAMATAMATASATPPLAVAVAVTLAVRGQFCPFGIDLKARFSNIEGHDWSKKNQGLGLQLKSFILTFRNISCHLYQKKHGSGRLGYFEVREFVPRPRNEKVLHIRFSVGAILKIASVHSKRAQTLFT